MIERVGLLLQLKAEPDNLRAALLSSIKAHMASTISEALQKQDDEDEEDGEEVKEDDVKRSRLLKRVSALTTAVAPPLVEHVSAFKKLFQSMCYHFLLGNTHDISLFHSLSLTHTLLLLNMLL